MPGGQYDSSRTRVAPVFNQLIGKPDWVHRLLRLPEFGASASSADLLNLDRPNHWWGETERGLRPPRSLLKWLVRNADSLALENNTSPERRRLFAKDAGTIAAALDAIDAGPEDRAWYVFEGLTFPDVVIETPDAIVVVEGKRTERVPTTSTTWMPRRHQIWRHIDAAWEMRGGRSVFGFFVVESDAGLVPQNWQQAATDALSSAAMAGSLPHRSQEERKHLADAFLGITTWRKICDEFAIDFASLPGTVRDLR